MKPYPVLRALSLLALWACALAGCRALPNATSTVPSVVGAWLVTIPEAPFQHHMFIFHADGTLVQSNPDAGDPGTSDSNGIGAWTAEGDHIVGKFLEVTADRLSHKFVGRGEILFTLRVQADSISGDGNAQFYESGGAPRGNPIAFTMSGSRIHAR